VLWDFCFLDSGTIGFCISVEASVLFNATVVHLLARNIRLCLIIIVDGATSTFKRLLIISFCSHHATFSVSGTAPMQPKINVQSYMLQRA